MLAAAHGSEMLGALLKIIGYGSLFAFTIWRYRKNRTIVLGVATVCLFFVFALSTQALDLRRFPDWLLPSILLLIVLAGIVVLIFVAIDVVCWFRGRGKSVVDANSGGQ